MEFDERVVIDKLKQPRRAGDEARHNPSRMDRLEPVGDHAPFHQRHNIVGKHFGMDAEIVPVSQPAEHGIGDRADPQLEAGPILHQIRHLFADGGGDG